MARSPARISTARRNVANLVALGLIGDGGKLQPPSGFRFVLFNSKPIRFGGRLVTAKVS